MRAPLATVLLLAAIPVAGRAQSVDEICRTAASVDLSESPASRTNGQVPCDAEALYYGIGRPADPAEARRCAVRQSAAGDDSPFRGKSLLMTIYANGRGAPRDLPKAIALACVIGGAPAEIEGRVRRLARYRDEGWTGSDFGICQDGTSGLLQGFCASHESQIAGVGRDQAIAELSNGWSSRRRAALARLRAASNAYGSARARHEVDLSGTARGAIQVEAQDEQADALLATLRALLAATSPPAARSAEIEARLNATYRQIMAHSTETWGTVDKEGIRQTQRAWLLYRDAFTSFAKAVSPHAAERTLAALTEDRIAILREFLS